MIFLYLGAFKISCSSELRMKSFFFVNLGPALFVIPPAVLAHLYKCLGQTIALPWTLGIGSAGISKMLQFYIKVFM